jgi:phage shock protein E
MPKSVTRDEVRRFIEEGAQIVEVLPREEYEEEHLPGAINLPLRKIENDRSDLDPNRPVVVYCWDPA